MANYKESIVDIELTKGHIHRSFYPHALGAGDENADRFGVRLFRNGQPENITGNCFGLFVRPDGETVPIENGVVSGNTAYVVLPDDCYAVEGVYSLAIKVSGGGVTGTMRIVDGMVDRTSTDVIVDPGTILPTIEDLIEAIQEAIETIPPEYSETVNAISHSINPAIYANTGNSINRYLSMKGTKATQNAIINSSGEEEEGTGSGNNWISDFVMIPADKRNLFVILPNAYWCAAFYDRNFNFLSFYDDNNIPDINGNVLTEVSIVNNAEFIRFGFYSGNGYTDEKYYDLFRVYSIVPNYKRPPFYNIANALPWGYTL